jgi:hypothetical protein
MSIRALAVPAAVATLGLTAAASASISLFAEAFLYDQQVKTFDRSTETFASYSGSYATPLTGAAGPVQWSANATGGLSVSAGRLSSTDGGAIRIDLSGAGVWGVSGNFFATNSGSGSVAGALVYVSMSDGTGFINWVDSATSFLGFFSSGGPISSIEITAASIDGTSVTPTISNLDFAYVPAPGSIALLMVANAVAPRRRR